MNLLPFEEGRAAAEMKLPFKDCPYTFGNCRKRNVAYEAWRRDEWFKGWKGRMAELGLTVKDMDGQGLILDDGFGNRWMKCDKDCWLEIVRPGKVQCEKVGCELCGARFSTTFRKEKP